MAEPTIIQGDNFQLCRIRFAHKPEDQLAYRYSSDQPWTVMGRVNDSLLALYYAAAFRMQAQEGGSGRGWYERTIRAGEPNPLGGGPMQTDIGFLAAFPGYPFRSEGTLVNGLWTAGSFSIVRIGTAGRKDFTLSREDAEVVWSFVTTWLVDKSVWDNLVPVDGDSSEHSKGVDYGRAW